MTYPSLLLPATLEARYPSLLRVMAIDANFFKARVDFFCHGKRNQCPAVSGAVIIALARVFRSTDHPHVEYGNVFNIGDDLRRRRDVASSFPHISERICVLWVSFSNNYRPLGDID